MTLNVCPADTVHAPLDRVWELLIHPAGCGSVAYPITNRHHLGFRSSRYRPQRTYKSE
jgi:hypothetical protein